MFRLPYKFKFYHDNDKEAIFTGQMSMNGEVICIVMWEKNGELTGVTYPEEEAIANVISETWTIVGVLVE